MDPLKPPYLAPNLALGRDRQLTRSSPIMNGVATYPIVSRSGTSSGIFARHAPELVAAISRYTQFRGKFLETHTSPTRRLGHLHLPHLAKAK
jgi:hypothetical protein